MKRPYAALLATAIALGAAPAFADGDGVFKAAVYDESARVVKARAGGFVGDAEAPALRLVVKAEADDAIRVRAVDPAGAVLATHLLRTDALGVASVPLAMVSAAGRGTSIEVEQGGSGRVLRIGLGGARVAAR